MYYDLAYLLMAQPLCHLERAYFIAYKHAKRAVELTDYTDGLLLENLLFYMVYQIKLCPMKKRKTLHRRSYYLKQVTE